MWGKSIDFPDFYKNSVSSILDDFSRFSALEPVKTDRGDQPVLSSGLRMSGEGPDF